MPVSYTPNFKNVLDKLRSILRSEFKQTVQVFIGHEEEVSGSTQYIRLDPVGSELTTMRSSGETREYEVQMYFYFINANIENKNALDHVLRIISRIEATVVNNRATTLKDSSDLFNCRVDSTELDALDKENEYVVLLVWKGQHTSNIS